MEFGPDDEIDYDGPVTPYRQLAAILKARVARGDWQPNRAIPSEARLVQEYGPARTTVRRAIALLVEEGVLFVVPQRGTYVAKQQPDEETPRPEESAEASGEPE
jgi:DNA-binding GntR family transcriptional regulator